MLSSRSLIACCAPAALLFLPVQAKTPVVTVRPAFATEAVSTDPADPAIWVNPIDPEKSLMVGTSNTKAPDGVLSVFGMDGKIRQTLASLDGPTHVDVEYGLTLNGKPTDIAVVTERLKNRLRVFAIAPDGSGLTDVSSADGLNVFAGEEGETAAPMGIGLYKRPGDGAIFAIVSPKAGLPGIYLGQYRLEDDGTGKVKAALVRRFGNFSGKGEIEAVAVDDALGHVYYADEGDGIHKYHADPDHPNAAKELAHFGKTGFSADRKGIALYTRKDGTGYILCTDQIKGSSETHLFKREGEPDDPDDHSKELKVVRGGADATDGLEATAAPVGAKFPNGLVIAMNSGPKNFLVYRWEDFAHSGNPRLKSGRGDATPRPRPAAPLE